MHSQELHDCIVVGVVPLSQHCCKPSFILTRNMHSCTGSHSSCTGHPVQYLYAYAIFGIVIMLRNLINIVIIILILPDRTRIQCISSKVSSSRTYNYYYSYYYLSDKHVYSIQYSIFIIFSI